MFWFIYHLPLHVVAISIFIAPVIWAFIVRSIKDTKKAKTINNIFAIISFLGIVYVTLFRSSSGEREIILMPFHSFIEALEQKEMYRSMLMNVALFVPLGITLPFTLHNAEIPVKKTILASLVMSAIIELLQLLFAIGRCETDDIICNSLGAAIGGLSYFISEKLNK